MIAQDNDRIVHTSMYTKKALEVLNSVFGQCSDGAYENNPRYDKYWQFGDACQEVDGEVTIHISAKSGESERCGQYRNRWVENAFFKMSDIEVKTWMANMVKRIMQMELRDEHISNGWRRDNTSFMTRYLNYNEDINVAEVYCIYEQLLGREIGVTKYNAHTICSVFGSKLQPEEIEAETAKREAVKAVERTYVEQVKALEAEEKQAVDELNAKIDEIKKMYYDKRNAAWHEKQKKLEAMT